MFGDSANLQCPVLIRRIEILDWSIEIPLRTCGGRLTMLCIFCLGFVALILGAERAAAASSTKECADLVSIEERRRGKGGFLSGCSDLSPTSGRGGCWSSLIDAQRGCQTCIVQDMEDSESPVWVDSLFATMFQDELDPCPEEVAQLYSATEESIVTLDSLRSPHCGDWLSFGDSCYFKSTYLDLSTGWSDAEAECSMMGARLVSIESQAESNFVIQNLLWAGFLGEAYLGLRKESGDGDWTWSDTLPGYSPATFDALTSFQDWGATLDASSSYAEDGPSCLEITPYVPKKWNPFSCEVNKQYVCEKPAGSQPMDFTPTVKPSPAPTSAPMISPTPSSRAAPSPFPAPVTPVAPVQGSPTVKPTEAPETPTPTAKVPIAASTQAPSASPTVAEVGYDEDGHCDELLTEADRSYLSRFDKSVYVEPLCVSAEQGAPVWCNTFGIDQECRSCWLSCDGAGGYIDEFPWFNHDIINFCPWVEPEDYDRDCVGEFRKWRALSNNKRPLLRGS